MDMQFELSSTALEQYRHLRFDPDSPYTCFWIPYGTLGWQDEHPQRDDGSLILPKGQDRLTMIDLTIARQYIWHDGKLPEDLNAFWAEACQAIPEWPGFRRLEPSSKEFEAILACEAQSHEVLKGWNEGPPIEEDEIDSEGFKRRRWQFWR